MKRIIILFLLLFSCCTVSAQNYWIKQPGFTSKTLTKCFFINTNTGWIAGDSGMIARTTNAGQNWIVQNTNILNDIKSIFFINERLGWAVSYEVFPDSLTYLGTRVLKTSNGGINWINYMYPDTNIFMRAVYFRDSLTGFMSGAPSLIVRTTDAGSTWIKTDTDTSLILGFPVECVSFVNNQIGYASGGFRDIAGAMWVTTNGGLNWKGQIVAPEPINDIYIFNLTKAIAAGGDFEFGSSTVKTFNQGVSWQYDTIGTFGVASSIDFRTPKEGWITLGVAQKFSYTLDSGNRWNTIFSPDSTPVYDVQFIDSLHGWSVGANGAIYLYSNLVFVNENEILMNKSFELFQNYPNPFNPVTVINYNLKRQTQNVKLVVYNILGSEVQTLINEKQNPGSHSVNFYSSNLASGIYFYELIAGDHKQVKRMLLLK